MFCNCRLTLFLTAYCLLSSHRDFLVTIGQMKEIWTSSAQLKIGLRKVFVEHKDMFKAIYFAVNSMKKSLTSKIMLVVAKGPILKVWSRLDTSFSFTAGFDFFRFSLRFSWWTNFGLILKSEIIYLPRFSFLALFYLFLVIRGGLGGLPHLDIIYDLLNCFHERLIWDKFWIN